MAELEPMAYRLCEAFARKNGPFRDIMGPYWESFCRWVESAWPDSPDAERMPEALAYVNDVAARAEAKGDRRGETRALYLQQRLHLEMARLQTNERGEENG